MKSIIILQDVSIPNVPGFRAGLQVRVSDEIADLLIERSFAKLGSITEQANPQTPQESVQVKKTGGRKVAL